MEDQVKTRDEEIQTLEGEIKDLNEKLSAANSEMTTKDNLVKQHAKVAEEAVSGIFRAKKSFIVKLRQFEFSTYYGFFVTNQ